MSLTRQALYNYISANFGIDVSAIAYDTPLFSSGFLDSFSVADLLVFLETTGDFVIDPEEVTVENLDSINDMLDFYSRKMQTLAGSTVPVGDVPGGRRFGPA